MNYDDVYETLIDIGRKYGFRPDVPLEAKISSVIWFRTILARMTNLLFGLKSKPLRATNRS